MPVSSADSTQIAIVEETVPGTTPATPAFLVWRTSGESVVFSPNVVESNELSGEARSALPPNIGGVSVAGDINFELAKFPALDAAIEGVLGNAWGQCPLTGAPGGGVAAGSNTVGKTLKTYTLEKRFLNPDGVTYAYQRYKGCTFSVFSLDIAPNEIITGSVSIVGGLPELSDTEIAGATYAVDTSSAVFTAPEVLEISIPGMAVATHCFTSLNVTLDSQNRGIPCIGSQGDREVVLGQMIVTLAGEVYFADQSILQAILDNAALGDGYVALTNADGDVYRFDLYGLKPTSGELTAGGTGEDLIIPFEMQPTPVAVCQDTGPPVVDWAAGVIISQSNTAPTLP